MSTIHPMLVHFPIALLSTGLIFDVIAGFSRRAELQRVGWWMMVSGTVSLILGLASGLGAEADVVINTGAQAVLDSHKQFAFLLAGLVTSAFFWRLSCRGALPSRRVWLFWSLYGAGICLLWVVAWFGGVLVHEHGVSAFVP